MKRRQEGVWMIDAGNHVTFVNRKMGEMIGYASEEMINQTIFAFMDDEWRSIAESQIAKLRASGKEQFDFKCRRKDGSELWIIASTCAALVITVVRGGPARTFSRSVFCALPSMETRCTGCITSEALSNAKMVASSSRAISIRTCDSGCTVNRRSWASRDR
ncbi:MAG: PAS domain S-box protein [Pseudanabaena sp. RU_4_16]|nr:PAS domain S-box protein [Pseudanabaena sp. RU_4_16]